MDDELSKLDETMRTHVTAVGCLHCWPRACINGVHSEHPTAHHYEVSDRAMRTLEKLIYVARELTWMDTRLYDLLETPEMKQLARATDVKSLLRRTRS